MGNAVPGASDIPIILDPFISGLCIDRIRLVTVSGPQPLTII
jgi:hypothetical protein